MNYPSLVSLREVAPRDGWQKFKTVLPTEVKRELICSMIDYGARELEIGVFSSDPVRGRQYQDTKSWGNTTCAMKRRCRRRCSPMPQRGESR
jgi:hydroxymethylglutaryl-CoA lyase